MKYYVYAGYYENFISGHKLPKPYTLRDEFKTFDDALDYVLENWEDDAIFFTEDVISDAIDNGFINDEDWENYLMEESKNSTRKSIKESINGDCYIYFDDNDEIYGKNRRWVFCDNVKGITDTRDFFSLNDFIIDAIHIFKNEKQAQKFIDEHLKYFEDKDKVVIAEYPQTVSEFYESKEFARKSMKEQFVGKGEGGYRKPDKTKFNSGICLDSNGVKHTVIFDTHVEDFIVWVDDDNYLIWYVSSPQSLLNNLAESDLDENLILDIVALWEKLSKKHIKN